MTIARVRQTLFRAKLSCTKDMLDALASRYGNDSRFTWSSRPGCVQCRVYHFLYSRGALHTAAVMRRGKRWRWIVQRPNSPSRNVVAEGYADTRLAGMKLCEAVIRCDRGSL